MHSSLRKTTSGVINLESGLVYEFWSAQNPGENLPRELGMSCRAQHGGLFKDRIYMNDMRDWQAVQLSETGFSYHRKKFNEIAMAGYVPKTAGMTKEDKIGMLRLTDTIFKKFNLHDDYANNTAIPFSEARQLVSRIARDFNISLKKISYKPFHPFEIGLASYETRKREIAFRNDRDVYAETATHESTHAVMLQHGDKRNVIESGDYFIVNHPPMFHLMNMKLNSHYLGKDEAEIFASLDTQDLLMGLTRPQSKEILRRYANSVLCGKPPNNDPPLISSRNGYIYTFGIGPYGFHTASDGKPPKSVRTNLPPSKSLSPEILKIFN